MNQLIKGNTQVDIYNPSNSTGNSASTNFYNTKNSYLKLFQFTAKFEDDALHISKFYTHSL